MVKANCFDYIIVGNGLAGLQLALKFCEDPFFIDKKIALLDKSTKTSNDKTWCFWESGIGKWDGILYKSWKKGFFYSTNKSLELSLSPCSYKMIRSIDFYNHAKEIISKKKNFYFINDTIEAISESDYVQVKGLNDSYVAKMVFDSRISKDYFNSNDKYLRIHQHFKGWVIETDEDIFNPEKFTMMDYRIKYNDDTTFTYVLPFSKRKALIEFTFFTPYQVESNVYDFYLEEYITNILKVKKYKIVDKEIGVIPMTNFPFSKYNSPSITKIGTAGGWVKSSTGYSFKHTEKKVEKLVDNIKNKRIPSEGLINKKYSFYDSVLLQVLNDDNKKGEWVFETFYSKNSAKDMFKFLDEETSFFKELRIMSSLISWPFIKAFFNHF